ncbi:NAD(P)-dependent oxidoreductase [Salimicrobium halophilum]|uniref:Putative NADH-flavin reductase n=1 Tax=Salimicrobium halophilum TaxID=86666 RepID=A0A1G8TP77_9BACI|nr:NAD(P)H-binding protein [Salimicrobium halophilum]SDJ42490.1 Putative NADH-flavin reductase [Salimicrobium halophilum]
MDIAILGATGRVGSAVANALAKEHNVTALVRNMDKAHQMLDSDISLIEGDVLDEQSLTQALVNKDVVFSGLSTDKTTTLSESIPEVIRIMKENGVPRIITIGTAGILNSRTEEGKLRYETNESKRRLTFAAEEHEKVFRTLAEEDREWIILCPTYLPDEQTQGPLREEIDYLPEEGKKAPVQDVADIAIREILSPSYKNVRVGLAL